jgi:drug/metabolite transporter (DMT)-like permease
MQSIALFRFSNYITLPKYRKVHSTVEVCPIRMERHITTPGVDSRRFLPLLSISFTTLLWGLSFISIKVAVAVIPPMSLAFSRFFVAAILLRVLLWRREPGFKLDTDDRLRIILSGLLGVTLYFFFENNGVKLISASSASIIVAGIPVVTMLADSLFFASRLRPIHAGSVVLSVLGVYLVVEHGLALRGESILGYLFMFGSVVTWVVYNFQSRTLFRKYSQLAIVYKQTLFGTIAFIPFLFFEAGQIQWVHIDVVIVLHVLYLGIFCSALGYTFYMYALDHLGVGPTTLYINLIPVITVIASALFLQESIGVKQISGAVLVIAAVTIVSVSKSRSRRRSK